MTETITKTVPHDYIGIEEWAATRDLGDHWRPYGEIASNRKPSDQALIDEYERNPIVYAFANLNANALAKVAVDGLHLVKGEGDDALDRDWETMGLRSYSSMRA